MTKRTYRYIRSPDRVIEILCKFPRALGFLNEFALLELQSYLKCPDWVDEILNSSTQCDVSLRDISLVMLENLEYVSDYGVEIINQELGADLPKILKGLLWFGSDWNEESLVEFTIDSNTFVLENGRLFRHNG